MTARQYLTTHYLDYRNNYLTVAVFAEHNGLTEQQATNLLAIAKDVFYSNHPQA